MAHQFATEEWLQAIKQMLNRSASFREAARNWRTDMLWVVVDVSPVYVYLDLRYGECLEAARLTAKSQRSPELVLEGTLAVWQKVFQKKLGLLQAIMTRELTVSDGQSVKLLGAPTAAQELVNVIAAVETEWPA